MAVGIVADDAAGVEPQHLAGAERAGQDCVDVVAAHAVVARGREQAVRRHHKRAAAVALDAAALQYKGAAVFVAAAQQAGLGHAPGDIVVELSRKLAAPRVEAEIVEHGASIGVERHYHAVIAYPGIVGRAVEVYYRIARIDIAEQAARALRIGRDHHQRRVAGDGCGQLHVASFHTVEHICPVGRLVGPRYEHTALWLPLGGQAHGLTLHRRSR